MPTLKSAQKSKASRTKVIKKSKRDAAPSGQEHAGLAQLRRVLGEALPELARDGLLPPKQLAHMIGLKIETVRALVYGRLDFRRDAPANLMFAANLSVAFGVHPSIREHADPDKAIRDLEGKPYTAETYRKWREATNDRDTGARLSELLVGENDHQPAMRDPLPEQARNLLDRIFRVIRREHDFTRDLVACNLVKKALFGVADELGIMKSLQQEMNVMKPGGERPLFSGGASAVKFSREMDVIAYADIDIKDPDKPLIQVVPMQAPKTRK